MFLLMLRHNVKDRGSVAFKKMSAVFCRSECFKRAEVLQLSSTLSNFKFLSELLQKRFDKARSLDFYSHTQSVKRCETISTPISMHV